MVAVVARVQGVKRDHCETVDKETVEKDFEQDSAQFFVEQALVFYALDFFRVRGVLDLFAVGAFTFIFLNE